jgi:hypothetical protein
VERSNEEIRVRTKPSLALFYIFNFKDLRPVI